MRQRTGEEKRGSQREQREAQRDHCLHTVSMWDRMQPFKARSRHNGAGSRVGLLLAGRHGVAPALLTVAWRPRLAGGALGKLSAGPDQKQTVPCQYASVTAEEGCSTPRGPQQNKSSSAAAQRGVHAAADCLRPVSLEKMAP
eukprot:4131118-Pleurochrysis_carterae.AAC.2